MGKAKGHAKSETILLADTKVSLEI